RKPGEVVTWDSDLNPHEKPIERYTKGTAQTTRHGQHGRRVNHDGDHARFAGTDLDWGAALAVKEARGDVDGRAGAEAFETDTALVVGLGMDSAVDGRASASELPRGLDRRAGGGSAALIDDQATERRCGGDHFSRRQLDHFGRFGDCEVHRSLSLHGYVRDGE